MVHSFSDLINALRKDDAKKFTALLLTYGWPTNFRLSDCEMLSKAINFKSKKIVNFLLGNRCSVSKPGSANDLVHVAVKYCEWTDVVVKLIKRGAPVSTVDGNGDTAVHVAFKNSSNGDLIDLLLKTYVRETTKNVKDSDGLSILHIASSRSNVEVVSRLTYRSNRMLVTRDDINQQVRSEYGLRYSRYTPLHFAVKNRRTEVVRFLLKQFASIDMNLVDANYSTPLHLALEKGDMDIMDLLLAYDKVHMDKVNNMGLSHFMVACAGTNSSFAVEYLRKTQFRSRTSPSSLLNNKVEKFSASPYRGYAPLHFAAEFGRLETVQLLLDNGASRFVKTAENDSPLVVALKRGHESVSRLLFSSYKAYRQSLFVIKDQKKRSRAASGASSPTELSSRCSRPPPGFGNLKATRLSPPPGFGSQSSSRTPSPPRFGNLKAIRLSPPPGFGSHSSSRTPSLPSYGNLKATRLSPPPGFGSLSGSRTPSPPGSNGQNSPLSPRPGLVQKQVADKPPGFSSSTLQFTRLPPGFSTKY